MTRPPCPGRGLVPLVLVARYTLRRVVDEGLDKYSNGPPHRYHPGAEIDARLWEDINLVLEKVYESVNGPGKPTEVHKDD